MIAKVLIDNANKKLNKVYDYLIKTEAIDNVSIGKRVLVNFGAGKGRLVEGIVVKIIYEKDERKLKCIEEVLDTESYIDENKLKLAKWMSRMYFCNVYTVLKLMLPQAGSKLKKKEVNGKQIKVVKLIASKDVIEQDIENKKITSAKHIRLLRELIETPNLPVDDIVSMLGVSKAVIKTIEEKGYIKIEKQDVAVIDYSSIKRDEKLEPTEEQKKVIDSLINKINENKFNVSLLFGVTGSGKTEVYLQAIEECLRLNKTAIVLVPEISLTDQTKRRFISRFGDVVSVLHSKLTTLEKQSEYKRIVKGQAKIVIGPRSALFVPLKNIGLIVIDEEHDTSYVSGSTPRYNTKEVASYLAHNENAVLLLGSATPDICTMYKAKEGKIECYEMLNRPKNYTLPTMEIADMKEEALLGRKNILSTRLIHEIEKNINAKEQTFIYLNRRGYSSYIVCGECGKTLRCPNCDVSLTYHKKNGLLLCHYCSYCETISKTCPICGKEGLKEGGTGTEKIENELKELFPEAKIARMDMDTTIKRGSHEKILNDFRNNNMDILVGTQMISKGHDIENVTLVGIINADQSAGDDYNSVERTFSNLLQVSGRAGRGAKKGRVILQATDTTSYMLESLYNSSYKYFYNKEINFRQMASYPPFVDIVVVELSGKIRDVIIAESKKLHKIFENNNCGIIKVYSPKVPFIGRINNKYRVQMVLKTKIDNKVLDLIYENLEKYDKIKDSNVSVIVTKNPIKIG